MSVYIITHKQFEKQMETYDYKRLLVGAYRGHTPADCYDDTGDNISRKNENYCELTGIYWIWKNTNDPYVGICHYRRYFTHDFWGKKALSPKEIERLLSKYDAVLPFHANYKMSIAEDYARTSGKKEDLEKVGAIIRTLCPEYLEAYNRYMNGTKGHLYNMIITRKELYDSYCQWLFSILFELEKHIDIKTYDDYTKRIYGFLAERLLNVWIIKNKIRYCEVGVLPTEEKRSAWVKLLTGLKTSLKYALL